MADDALAKEHFYKAEALFASRKFSAAVVEYKAAYDVSPLPEFLFNIAQCYRALEDYKAAIWYFRLYLIKAPDAPSRTSVNALIDEMQAKLDAQAVRRRKWGYAVSVGIAVIGVAIGGLVWSRG